MNLLFIFFNSFVVFFKIGVCDNFNGLTNEKYELNEVDSFED